MMDGKIVSNKLSSSEGRNTFQRDAYLERMAEEGRTPENDENVKAMVEYYNSWNTEAELQEARPEWQQNNLEYDLRSTEWILKKARDSEAYAQNLYAALCNNEFIKNDIWPILKSQTWSCTWRYAGGIVADMRQDGDYIDWYCSGIRGMDDDQFQTLDAEAKERYLYIKNNFVGEGVVSDEVRNDLLKLGWIVTQEEEE